MNRRSFLATATVAEMLVEGREGEIAVLPARPSEWPSAQKWPSAKWQACIILVGQRLALRRRLTPPKGRLARA